jgi:hypothetical protein
MENTIFEQKYYTLEVLIEKWGTEELEWKGFISFKSSHGKARFTTTTPTEGKKFATLEEVELTIDSMRDYKPAKAFQIHKACIDLLTSRVKNTEQ